MADTGWKSPGTVDAATGYDNSWVNPDNVKVSDNSYSTVASGSYFQTTAMLYCTNFNFGIPAGNVVVGIEARVEGYISGSSFDCDMGLRINGSDDWKGPTTEPSIGTTEQYYMYGGSSESWGGNYTTEDVNSSGFGCFLRGNVPAGQTIYIDHIQMKVYYTPGTIRGLYIKGKDTGYSVRGLYLEGFAGTTYSRESSSSLGSDDTTLATVFSEADYTTVGTDDDNYVNLEGIQEYFQFLFKEKHTNNTDNFKITWKGKSTLAPSVSTVYLQIYNRTTSTWTTLTSNNTASANTKFTLESTISSNLSDYYDSNYIISARVYQDVVV